MTTSGITLSSCRDMLLDVENRDTERVKRELGTANAARKDSLKEGTGLIGEGGSDGRRSDKKKKKKKSAKLLKRARSIRQRDHAQSTARDVLMPAPNVTFFTPS